VLREASAALRERDFRLLFLARTASLLGSSFAPVALAFAVLDDLDGSPTELGLVLAAQWVPQILLTLVGGVWADRLPRNLVMVGTDLTMFAVQAIVAALLLTGTAELWHVLALQAVRGSADAFFWPAAAGLTPHVVSESRLQEANALLRLSNSMTRIVGAAAAGVVVAAVGSGWALAFDATTFLASAAFLVRLRLPRTLHAKAQNLVRELREGWDEFRSRTWLWAIVLAASLGNLGFGAAISVLGPAIANRDLGGAAAWGAIVSSEAVGFLLGGLLSLRIRPERPLVVAMLGILLSGPLFVLLAVAAPLPLIMAAGVVAGIGIEVFGVLWDTALQQHVPRERLSRVAAWDQLGSFVVIPIGLTIVGPIAAAIGVTEALLLFTAVVLVPNALVLLSRDVRTLRRVEVAARREALPPRMHPQTDSATETAAS
jgi:predicted MFS family arabinose efflux permease